ncbi:DUF222 domain-containing protein, partial [Arthrobacter sp. YAF17]|uniref:DUF222 domain-containing protein n=1 Tax=Arthrobacter sp. YAF17 TaxID=3233077 RepID=UPI003F8D9381
MKAAKDFITVEDPARGTTPAGHSGEGRVEDVGGQPGADSADSVDVMFGVDGALAALRGVGATAIGDSALWGFREASDFAGQVEELSRTVEYLQLVGAAAVDRTRKQSAAAAAKTTTAWTTGWRDDGTYGTPATPDSSDCGSDAVADAPAMGAPRGTAGIAVTDVSSGSAAARDGTAGCTGAAVPSGLVGAVKDSVAVDDGYRNTAEFLRARLRISAAESRRRLCLGEALLPRQGFAGELLPPVHAELGSAVASGEVASRAATIISLALGRVRHVCDAEAAARMEHALTRTAAENDPDFLSRMARSWVDALDQDGTEPSEELLRQLQGAFIRKPRHGLQHLEIFATAEQFEHLLTVMNTATNPRPAGPDLIGGPETAAGNAAADAPCTGVTGAGTFAASSAATGSSSTSADATNIGGNPGLDVPLDLRSRPQKLLDGLVGACKVALAAGTLPTAGGLRPQVMVTIDYRALFDRLGNIDGVGGQPGGNGQSTDTYTGTGSSFRPGTTKAHTGTLLFTGPVTASTARKIACDADIIPVLLGGEGRILDIGRASRVFPP